MEMVVDTIETCGQFTETASITWINISGIHDVDMIQALGNRFNLHPLVLEDVLYTVKRPRWIILIRIFFARQDGVSECRLSTVHYEQVSLIVGPSYVISFQEMEGMFSIHVRDRIRHAKGRIGKKGAIIWPMRCWT